MVMVFSFSKHKKADAAQIFHDTAGWKHLETSMRFVDISNLEKVIVHAFMLTSGTNSLSVEWFR